MSRIRLLLVAALAALALVASSAQAATVKLVATDGPGFTITLTKNGKKVTTLPHGVYKIVVNDKSNLHNFHLIGKGLNKSTSVTAVASKTWIVTLKAGTYKFICDPHASFMKGSFKVT
jgi:plastocyanin